MGQHIENLDDGCVSLNFWFKDQSTSKTLTLPLSEAQRLAMRRNIEKLCGSSLGARKAQRLLPTLASSSPPAEIAGLAAEIRKLLAHVLPAEQIDPWLRDLVERRFELELE